MLTLPVFHNVLLFGVKIEANGMLENLTGMSLKVPGLWQLYMWRVWLMYILRQLQVKLTILFLLENRIHFTLTVNCRETLFYPKDIPLFFLFLMSKANFLIGTHNSIFRSKINRHLGSQH